MTIFDQLEDRATGMRHRDEFDREPIGIAQECIKTGEIRPTTYAYQHEHELRLRIYSRFWTNQAEFHDARVHAERALANLLHQDVLVALDGIAHAISDGDRRAALARCGQLRASLMK